MSIFFINTQLVGDKQCSAQWGQKGGQADLDFFLKLASPQ